ncbi:hypothetical protein N657DRAFT_554828, partial [Parathielavia appendiculata]
PFNTTLQSPTDAFAQAAAYYSVEQQPNLSTLREPSPEPDPRATDTNTNTNADPSPQQIAIKRTKYAKSRLATAHEGWTIVVQTLLNKGIVPADEGLTREMKAFGDAMCGRYAAASFLWRVLDDMPEEDWFGEGEKFDATLRRLKTLERLEGRLVCWEGVVLRLVELVEGMDGEERNEGVVDEVRRLLTRWRSGVPRKP